ncbi:MAG: cyanophycinase [Acidobacteriia bacterium]|nr:cyanophycinase [Terriglobia bacterium]
MKRAAIIWMLATAILCGVGPAGGPRTGALVVAGGGDLPEAIVKKFIELAGGVDSPVVVIPTAGESAGYSAGWKGADFLRKAGCKQVTVLHTQSRTEADSLPFVAPLRKAKGVWFPGGRQWRLVDSYLHTRTQRELEKVLERGGVIGGTSAGATIQGSYLVRGAREGNTVMMAPGYEAGFGYLRNVAVDQHLIKRRREKDLEAVIVAHPELLGIGIDEGTAIIVQGDVLEVMGASKVAIYEAGKPYYFLPALERFDLRTRQRVR